MNDEAPLSLLLLVIAFYVVGLCIVLYIRIRRIYLIRQIKKTGRVISLSSTIISLLLQQLQNHQQGQQLSPITGLPPPPPYTIENPDNSPLTHSVGINEPPPAYVEIESNLRSVSQL